MKAVREDSRAPRGRDFDSSSKGQHVDDDQHVDCWSEHLRAEVAPFEGYRERLLVEDPAQE